jgi:type I restriction enzyme S subunit
MNCEMKKSESDWIGEIPKDWNMVRMKSCISQRDGGAWGDEATGEGGDFICLRIADFDFSRFRFKDTPESELTYRNYKFDVANKLLLKKNDIVIEKSGGGEKNPVGRTVLFDKPYDALFANFCERLRCREIVIPSFMQYIFVAFYLNRYVWNYIKQTTGIQNLDLTSLLENEKVALPSIDVQEKIVEYLDAQCAHIDSVIEKTKASIEEYKKLKQAVITQAVTKGIRGERPMKDSEIDWLGEIPEEWISERGKNLFVETNERSTTGTEELLTVSHITGITPRAMKNVNMFMSESLVDYKICHKGDIAANTMWMWQGAIGVSDYEGVISPSYNTYRQWSGSYDSEYLDYLLRIPSLVTVYAAYSTGITASRLRLYPQQFFSIIFPVPPLEEQKEIADYLDKKCTAIDTLISKKEQCLTELENYKKSLIYEYVTGKKEVP